MKNKDFINQIRDDYSPQNNRQRTLEGYASSIKTLAEDLYAKNTHFIFELIQNAEDNDYASGAVPTLCFTLKEIELNGQRQTALIIENNEIGFQEKHVNAICKVGNSTKDKTQGYIGEKGIGFKSVFKITNCPHIFSNGFYFSLPEKDEETGLGYIVPRWIDNVPNFIQENTTIILPLNKKAVTEEELLKYLHDIAPETILFLQKIKTLEISVELPEHNYSIIIEKDNKATPLVELTYLRKEEDGNETIESSQYWLISKEFPKPENVTSEKRTGIGQRTVSVAISLEQESRQQKLFAYLPVWENTGLPFLINADFLLVSSRERVHEDEPWNKWLRACIPAVYVEAFLSCLQSEQVAAEQKYALYSSIPLQSNQRFLEPIVAEIQEKLKEQKVILTEPDSALCKPEQTFFAPKKFRDLLTNQTYPETLLHEQRLVVSGIETCKEQLQAIGVKSLSSNAVKQCFQEREWVSRHDYDWLLRVYQYLVSQNFEKNDLTEYPIVPVKKEGSLYWSCSKEQPIYFNCAEECRQVLKELPDCVRVPLVFLDDGFFGKVKDQEGIRKWMTDALDIHNFSKTNYAKDVFKWLQNNYDDINDEDLISTTDFLLQFGGSGINFNNLPVLLADDKRVSLSEINRLDDIQAIVVPENFSPEFSWQHIFTTEDDRRHFVWLSDRYHKQLVEQLLKKKKIARYPGFAKMTYTNTWGIPSPEMELLYRCRQAAADAHRWRSKVDSFLLPTGLKDSFHPKAILSLLKTTINAESWGWYDTYLHEHGLIAKGVYYYRGKNSEYADSSILSVLKTAPWLPTTKGNTRPDQAFLPRPEIKEILGDSVPYFEDELPQNLAELLGIRTKTTIDELVSVLEQDAQSGKGDKPLAERVYSTLISRNLPNDIIQRLQKVIFNPSGSRNRWVTAEEAIWKDRSDILGDDFVYLEKFYPKLKDFFVEKLRVKEDVDNEVFARRWLKLQKNPIEDKKEQDRIVAQLYRKLKPIAQSEKSKQLDWWGDFRAKAKLYTQSRTFEYPKNIFVPDDGELKDIFKDHHIYFAWRPPHDSFSDWWPFYEAFDIPTLSNSVKIELVDAEYNETPENQYLTEDAVKMIATWLREKEKGKYQQLLKGGVFKKLLEIKEAAANSNIEVCFTLNRAKIRKSDYPVFWKEDSNTLILDKNDSNDSKIDIAFYLASRILGRSDYKDLAGWIELVLGADDTERLRKTDWDVPQEIAKLCKAEPSLPQQKPDAVEESSSPPTPHGDEHQPKHEDKNRTQDKSIPTTSKYSSERTQTPTDDGEKLKPVTPEPSVIYESTQELPDQADKDNESHLLGHKVAEGQTEPIVDYARELKQVFNREGESNIQEQSNDDGKVRNPDRRRGKSYETHRERTHKEPNPDERRKETIRTLLEEPDEQVRTYLFQMYGGKCQICDKTFPKRNGEPFFVASYIVPRKRARFVDTQANAMCLCADHFAQWRHGAVEAENILEQIDAFKTEAEGGNSFPVLKVKLIDEECEIKFKEKHLLDLQELLRASENQM